MKPVARVNSANTKTVKDSIKFFSFRRPKSSLEHVNSDHTNKTVRNHDNESLMHIHDGPLVSHGKDNKVINNTAVVVEANHALLSPGYSGHHSLPSTGTTKSEGLATKVLINSDTFSQTKTLLYTDHQKLPCNYSHRTFDPSAIKSSRSNSFDSLNSSNDPEIVAALDQIASKMGLIDQEMSETVVDPVHYLLATRSFSEKLSIHKKSINPKGCRVQSLTDNTDSNRIKLETDLRSKPPVTPVSMKKESSFRKMIQQFSPKLLRRTKSSSPTIIKKSLPRVNKHAKEEKINCNSVDDRLKVEETIQCHETSKLFNEMSIPRRSVHIAEDNTKKLNAGDNSERLYNSLRIDRVKCPYSKFMNMSKQRTDNNLPQKMNVDFQLDVHSIGGLAPEVLNHESKILHTYSPVAKPKTPSSPRYINISLSAFGYDPIGTLPFRRSRYQNQDLNISNTSEEYSSIENEINQK